MIDDEPTAFDEAHFACSRMVSNEDECFAVTDGDPDNLSTVSDPTTYRDIFEIPRNFEEAWNHPDPFQRMKWRQACRREFSKMKEMKVWRKIKRSKMPKGRRCVKCRWVLAIKNDGTFRARLVACGYSQVPGEDFEEVFSPVSNDVLILVILIIWIVYSLDARIIDVVTAFLHGRLDQQIFMECPPGLKHDPDDIVELLKTIYGLVQSARAFFNKYVEVLKAIGFTQSPIEPCLLYKRYEKGLIIMIIHVDDCFAVGNTAAIEETIELIKQQGLELKVESNIRNYLGCKIRFNEAKTKAWLGQPNMYKKLSSIYGQHIQDLGSYKTPGTPGLNLIKAATDDDKVSAEEQKLYRSGVGCLLYLVKCSRPDLANVVRELAKNMSGATPASMKELKRVVKFAIDTKQYGLKIEPELQDPDIWKMTVYTDSDWAGDKDNRHSVTGYIMYLKGVPILWKSRLQRTVALSSSEAEYYALSEAAKEIKFLIQVMDSIGITLQLPIIVHVDNIGAMFMADNVSATSRTRHVDARYHFVREFIFEGKIKVVFVKSADNKADGFTKCVNGEVYEKQVSDNLMVLSELT